MARIALVLPNLKCGGAERVAVTLATAFAGKGHQVDVLLMERTGEFLDCLPESVRVVDLRARSWMGAVHPLIRYLKENRPDAVQASMWPLTALAVIARRLSGSAARLVTLDHAILSRQYPRRIGLIRATVRHLYPMADARVLVSPAVLEDIVRLSGLPEQCFVVVSNPVDLPQTIPASPEVEALWGGEGLRILSVARLDRMKGQDLLLRAFARLPDDANAKLLLVGDGPEQAALQDLATALGIADRVIFRGAVADPWPYYASADLFALSSREESFGIALVEALHAELPIVSTPTAGATRVLDDGRFGMIADGEDPFAFAKALEAAGKQSRNMPGLRERATELGSQGSIDEHLQLLLGRVAERSPSEPRHGGG